MITFFQIFKFPKLQVYSFVAGDYSTTSCVCCEYYIIFTTTFFGVSITEALCLQMLTQSSQQPYCETTISIFYGETESQEG